VENRSARNRAGLFVVEGPQGVAEVVNHQSEIVRGIYLSTAAGERYSAIITNAQTKDIPVEFATPEVLQSISANAQEILAVAQIPQNDFDTWLKAAKDTPKLIVILNNVRDPGNAGTVIRVADAFGADCVILTGNSVELTNPKVVRSTTGSLFHLPVFTGESLAQLIASCKKQEIQILAADGHSDIELPTVPLAKPTAWVFGNEAWGLPKSDLALVDTVVKIPMRGHAESLNLATAATVCLWVSSQATAENPVPTT